MDRQIHGPVNLSQKIQAVMISSMPGIFNTAVKNGSSATSKNPLEGNSRRT